MNDMKKVLTCLMMLVTAGAFAQTDITKYYLENAGFDSRFDYTAEQTNNVTQELKEVDGWTSSLSANYTIVGTYEFGFKGIFNTATVPATGYDGEPGGGLAISTGWEQTFLFFQTVTLPAGTYTINVPTYNGSNVTAATSQVAWIPASGTAVRSTLSSYPAKEWTLDKITFTLTKATKGKIQFGMKAAPNGSANSAKLVVDYVQLLGQDMAVDKTELGELITTATALYGEGTGNGADALKTAIDAAQGVNNNADADIIAVLEATLALKAAIETYREQNVSEDNPLDKTIYITNPSFENGTKGWTNVNLKSQNNNQFTKQAGAYYMEKWVGTGSKVGDASITQTLTNLPSGIYKLTVAAQNLNQSATSQKCTGAYIFADDQQETVYTPADYSVKFTNISGEVKIGYVAEGATGNWLAVDNFRLYLIGEVNVADLVAELGLRVSEAEALQSSMMSAGAATDLQVAIGAAKLITTESEESAIQTAAKNLKAAVAQAQASIAEYRALSTHVEEVEQYYDESKEGATGLKDELDKAKALAQNAEATSKELAAEIEALDNALFAFNLANATPGTGDAPAVNATNHYVLTGVTQALVRATMTGGNILERGVCWSTSHEPTVLDNRSTKYFNLKGYLFHVTGLEPATVYYLRPYVMNKTYQVAYGDEVKIVTHPKGTCVGTWDGGAPNDEANARCRQAIQETIDYFNEWTGIQGFTLSGHYGADTPTADCSYGGWMRIGPNAGNQAIGTVLHETGHGVGVGTHWRWYNCADTRENTTWGKWLGREANKVLHFLENYDGNELFFTGDAVHGWATTTLTEAEQASIPNGKISFDWLVNGSNYDTHQEIQYIGGMCILYGLFIDGLCPTGANPNGISGYTYNFDEGKKYYLMNKNAERGLNKGLLYQRQAQTIGWKENLTDKALNDSAAWYIQYNASDGYYMFKNAATGKYLTHNAGGGNVALKNVTGKPGKTEYFQLMPDRTDVTIGTGNAKLKTHGYWFTWYDSNRNNNYSMGANALNTLGYGTITQTVFDYSNSATVQQWIIISEDELAAYQAAAESTGIHAVEYNGETGEGEKAVVGIFTPGGMRLQELQRGINIIRYSDGTNKKVIVK